MSIVQNDAPPPPCKYHQVCTFLANLSTELVLLIYKLIWVGFNCLAAAPEFMTAKDTGKLQVQKLLHTNEHDKYFEPRRGWRADFVAQRPLYSAGSRKGELSYAS